MKRLKLPWSRAAEVKVFSAFAMLPMLLGTCAYTYFLYQPMMLVSLGVGVLLLAKVFFLDHQTALVAFTVSLAIVIILVIAKLLGSMLPMLAKKIGIDPALMATPMIASVSDMITVIVYFWLASVMLGIG